MRRLTASLIAVATLGAIAGAHADENQGPYIGGGVGRYNIAIHNGVDFGNVVNNYDKNDTAYQFFVGYRFMPFLAVEGDYLNLGTARDNVSPGLQLQSKIYGWRPSLVGTLPLGPNGGVVGPIELFARVGEYWYRFERDYVSAGGQDEDLSNWYHHFTYGGGVGVVVAQRIPVRLEYDELKIQHTNKSNALWLTAAFRF